MTADQLPHVVLAVVALVAVIAIAIKLEPRR